MKFHHLAMLLLALATIGCAGVLRKPPASTGKVGYELPTVRPDDGVLAELEARLREQPDDPILNRDLGSLLQSRTSLVEPPLRWDLVRRANELLSKAQLGLPEDPQTLIFLGLARASRGRLPEVPLVSKLTTVLEGFSLIDQAVARDPQNFSLRLIRGKAEILAPAILGRGKMLEQDYRFLYDRTFKDKELAPHLRVLGLIWLGDYHYNVGKKDLSPHYWKKALQLESSFTQEIDDRLAGRNTGF